MKWSQRLIVIQLRNLAQRLRERLTPQPNGQYAIFRDKTVNHLHEAITDAGPALRATPAFQIVEKLATVMNTIDGYPRINAADLRESKLLREEIAACLKIAVEELNHILIAETLEYQP